MAQDNGKRVSTQEVWTADFKANILKTKLTVIHAPLEN